jgi:hypothetical protein
MLIHLYGFLEDDFLGRVIVVDNDRPVGVIADQLQAWGPDLHPRRIPAATVTNEYGDVLDPTSSLIDVGLIAGDIFHVGGDQE